MNVPLKKLNDGNEIPQLGLGVWKAEDGREVEEAVVTAIDEGYRLIDTAMVYQNERGVGNAIKDSNVSRDELFITTKLWNSDQGAANVRPALMESLEKLQLEYIDMYLIHWPTPARGLFVETWKQFEALKDEGLIRSIGVSNFRIEDLEELAKQTYTVPAVNQIELHPGFNQAELREYCANKGIQVESWSPIGGSKGNLLEDSTITKLADTYNKSPAQIVIRWHLQHDLVVIPKSTNDSRIAENIDVLDFELTPDDMKLIDALDSGNRQGPDPGTMNHT